MVLIKELSDPQAFRSRRQEEWRKCRKYWLNNPLRHVSDVGEVISSCSKNILNRSSGKIPTIVDMGCGEGWLYRYLAEGQDFTFRYLGLDLLPEFVEYCRREYSSSTNVDFKCVDLEGPLDIDIQADLVVNSFNLFELADLDIAMRNAAGLLKIGGRLLVATIDKSYLILALSSNCQELRDNLNLYSTLPGVKYAFQPIDRGSRASQKYFYPSVLYSLPDYISSAEAAGLRLEGYAEHDYTHRAIPKIYQLIVFRKQGG